MTYVNNKLILTDLKPNNQYEIQLKSSNIVIGNLYLSSPINLYMPPEGLIFINIINNLKIFLKIKMNFIQT